MNHILSLKNLSKICCTIALLASVYYLFKTWPDLIANHSIGIPEKIKAFSRLSLGIGLAMMSVFISMKAKVKKGGYLFALFLAAFVLNKGWFYTHFGSEHTQIFLLATESALTATLFINSVQFFPTPVTAVEIKAHITQKIVNRYMVWLLIQKNLWLIFFPIVTILGFICNLFNIRMVMLNLLIILSALFYMYLSYKKSGINSRNSILWMFWGVLCYIIFLIFSAILLTFNPSVSPYISLSFAIIFHLIILSTVFMSVFFAESFDTGFIIKRTIVDGLLFLLVILTYNVFEHYLLHTINHTLHINDAFLSSLLSGIMVLAISPLHHRLNSFLNRKFKQDTEPKKH